jgi:hypothetical protein
MLAIAFLSGCGGDDGPPSLLINEFMASNVSTLTDESGAYPDWIEIYNDGEDPAVLDGVSITDDLASPEMWLLPDTLEVPAGGYLVLFADGDTTDGDLHLPFLLDAAGDRIGLFGQDAEGSSVQLDAVSFGEQLADVASARVPNGGAEWGTTEQPTPGEANP